jgi:hypothetical protein
MNSGLSGWTELAGRADRVSLDSMELGGGEECLGAGVEW